MPYEVFIPLFFRCSETHEAHSKLEDAAACFSQLTQRYAGNIPIHPISQKYVYSIAAIDRKGNQRNFSNEERKRAKELKLDPKSLQTEIPAITTFSSMARVYCEALRLIPVESITLENILDHKNKGRHFWSTDAGIGQALAYAQQAAFTLELSLKAYLEVTGKLAALNGGVHQGWKTHNLKELFDLLTGDEKRQLEDRWNRSEAKRTHCKRSFREVLAYGNDLYTKWRYITEQKTFDLSIDIQFLLSASEFLLSASDHHFRKHSPIKMKTSVTTYPDQGSSNGDPQPPSVKTTLVEGRVRTVRIPDGFDPFSRVDLVIDSEQHEHDVIAQFFKRNVKDYYGLEGKKVTLSGEIKEDQPHLLRNPTHLDEPQRESKYTCEPLTLRGRIYDMRKIHDGLGGPSKIDLVLHDDTFFAQVECIFATEEERDKLTAVKLGDRVLISGYVTLLNGQPMVLVGPDHIEQITEQPHV